jgi:hypothetical protein
VIDGQIAAKASDEDRWIVTIDLTYFLLENWSTRAALRDIHVAALEHARRLQLRRSAGETL